MKNKDGSHEFKHLKFKRHGVKEIIEIKRKATEPKNEGNEDKNSELMNKFNDLKKNYQENKNSLDLISSQNKRLIDVNKELINKLYLFNEKYKIRIRKVLFIFYICSNYHDKEIEERLIKEMKEIGVEKIEEKELEGEEDIENKLSDVIRKLSTHLIFHNESDDSFLDKIIIFLREYLAEKLKLEKIRINWGDIANELFANSLIDEKEKDYVVKLKKKEEKVPIIVPQVMRSGKPIFNKYNINQSHNGFSVNSNNSRNISIKNLLKEMSDQMRKSYEEEKESENSLIMCSGQDSEKKDMPF